VGQGEGQLEKLEARLEELEAGIRDCIKRRHDLAQRGKALNVKLTTGPAEERPGIREQIRDLEAEYAKAQARETGLASKRTLFLPTVVAARRDLQSAERAVAAIENPPPWGLGQVSPDTVRELERRARARIRELIG